MLEFFQAIIILIYHQFASAAVKAFANVMTLPAFTNGGQHRGIAKTGFLTGLERKGGRPLPKSLYSCLLLVLGTPSSRSSLSLILVYTCIGATPRVNGTDNT